jgi:hypothetical protein
LCSRRRWILERSSSGSKPMPVDYAAEPLAGRRTVIATESGSAESTSFIAWRAAANGAAAAAGGGFADADAADNDPNAGGRGSVDVDFDDDGEEDSSPSSSSTSNTAGLIVDTTVAAKNGDGDHDGGDHVGGENGELPSRRSGPMRDEDRSRRTNARGAAGSATANATVRRANLPSRCKWTPRSWQPWPFCFNAVPVGGTVPTSTIRSPWPSAQSLIQQPSSQVKLLITNNAFCIMQRATAQSKTGNFS